MMHYTNTIDAMSRHFELWKQLLSGTFSTHNHIFYQRETNIAAAVH
jgi:hypothetical protein